MYILLIIFVILVEVIAALFAIIGIISLTKTVNTMNTEVCKTKKLVIETIINFRMILKSINIQIKTILFEQKLSKIVGIIETVAKISLLKKFIPFKKLL